MNKLSPIKKLDQVLKYLEIGNELNEISINIYLKEENIPAIEFNELKEIFQLLIEDGYVKVRQLPLVGNENLYTLTYKGMMFKIHHGYLNDYQKVRTEKKIQSLKDWLLIFGTILAGIGSLSLTVWEIYEHYYQH